MPRLTPANAPLPIQAEGYRTDVLPSEQALALLVGIVRAQHVPATHAEQLDVIRALAAQSAASRRAHLLAPYKEQA